MTFLFPYIIVRICLSEEHQIALDKQFHDSRTTVKLHMVTVIVALSVIDFSKKHNLHAGRRNFAQAYLQLRQTGYMTSDTGVSSFIMSQHRKYVLSFL